MSTTSSLFILLGLVAVVVAIGRAPTIRFFMNARCVAATFGNPYFNYTKSQNVTFDLVTGSFKSYCVIRGAWRVELSYLQHESDFNISVGDGCTSCYDARTNTKYGVIRLLAGDDLTSPTFSMYSDRTFKGHETKIVGGSYTFNDTYSFMSFAFTSYSNWTWQTYHLPYFRGNSTCHWPDPATEVTLVSSAALNVGSIRLGCRNDAMSSEIDGVGLLIGIIIAIGVPSVAVIL